MDYQIIIIIVYNDDLLAYKKIYYVACVEYCSFCIVFLYDQCMYGVEASFPVSRVKSLEQKNNRHAQNLYMLQDWFADAGLQYQNIDGHVKCKWFHLLPTNKKKILKFHVSTSYFLEKTIKLDSKIIFVG